MEWMLEAFPYILNAFFIVQIVSGGAMCIFGCKWRKGLIATLSVRIGIVLGLLFAAFLLKQSMDLLTLAFFSIFAIAIIFYVLAYKWVPLNHFLTGFLVGNKLAFMVVYRIMSEGGAKLNITVLLVVPLIVGLIAGFVVSSIFNYYTVTICIVYIGTVELVTGIADIINKTLFLATGRISYIFDLEDILLKVVGVEVPSLLEVVFILIVGIASFMWQRYLLLESGKDLSQTIVDDRNYKE